MSSPSLIANTQANLHSTCKVYTGLHGWILNLFGRTIKVINEKGDKLYFHKYDLINKLCLAANSDMTTVNTSQIGKAMLKLLAPVADKNVTIKKIEALFQEMAASLGSQKTTGAELMAKFDQLQQAALNPQSQKSSSITQPTEQNSEKGPVKTIAPTEAVPLKNRAKVLAGEVLGATAIFMCSTLYLHARMQEFALESGYELSTSYFSRHSAILLTASAAMTSLMYPMGKIVALACLPASSSSLKNS